jgi:hypothetical protein
MSAIAGLRLNRIALLGLCAAFVCCWGCEHAHYVVRNPDSGVVAIPEDTPELRAKAEKLMRQQFPGGFVLDDVRVVAVGGPHRPHEEVMLYYHAGTATSAGGPVAVVGAPPGTIVMPHVQPASLTSQPSDLPPQPVPVSGR